jgi:signal transduction histidine kinase
VAADLRPSILDDLGLIPALQWQAREFEARAGFPCETELASDLVQRNLDSDRSSALFRIAQELLTNVMRHARASRARLLLREESNGWLLEVSDNGRGIVAKDYVNPTTLGLRGMQERVALFGGTLEFRGEPEKGTTVRVWIPQQNDHAEVADRKAA